MALDVSAVLSTLGEYCAATDAKDAKRLEACFAPDAVFEVIDGATTLCGPAIAQRLARNGHLGHVHLTCNVAIAWNDEGTECSAASTFVVLDAEGRVNLFGRYADRLRADDEGVWRFVERVIRFEFRRA
jgi:hypothetical protein